MAGAAELMVFGRCRIRYKQAGKLSCDDYLNLAAAIILLCSAIIYQVAISVGGQIGLSVPTTAQLKLMGTVQLVDNMVWWAIVFLVKASFLATYWNLFKISKAFRVAWWIVVAYTSITFLALFLAPLWLCGNPSNATDLNVCNSPSIIRAQFVDVWWYMSLNVTGYLLIMFLPLGMLVRMNLSAQQKLGLGVIFAIVTINIGFDIARTILTAQSLEETTATLSDEFSNMLTLCEPALAVMVCTLPSYRTLLPNRAKKQNKAYKMLMGGCGGREKESLQSSKVTMADEETEDLYHTSLVV